MLNGGIMDNFYFLFNYIISSLLELKIKKQTLFIIQ